MDAAYHGFYGLLILVSRIALHLLCSSLLSCLSVVFPLFKRLGSRAASFENVVTPSLRLFSDSQWAHMSLSRLPQMLTVLVPQFAIFSLPRDVLKNSFTVKKLIYFFFFYVFFNLICNMRGSTFQVPLYFPIWRRHFGVCEWVNADLHFSVYSST